jgi:transcriptional regulator with XRE-family HTH domain
LRPLHAADGRTRVRLRIRPDLLRAAREARGITRQHVADEVPCSLSLVTLTELGYKRPAAETLAAIADAVGVSLDDLFVAVDKAVATS